MSLRQTLCLRVDPNLDLELRVLASVLEYKLHQFICLIGRCLILFKNIKYAKLKMS